MRAGAAETAVTVAVAAGRSGFRPTRPSHTINTTQAMLRYSAAAFLVFLLAGCATLFSGTEETITFNSEPSGAAVVIDGLTVGHTPLTIEVDRPGLDDLGAEEEHALDRADREVHDIVFLVDAEVDHGVAVVTGEGLDDGCLEVGIDHEIRGRERPSDHVPLWVELDA